MLGGASREEDLARKRTEAETSTHARRGTGTAYRCARRRQVGRQAGGTCERGFHIGISSTFSSRNLASAGSSEHAQRQSQNHLALEKISAVASRSCASGTKPGQACRFAPGRQGQRIFQKRQGQQAYFTTTPHTTSSSSLVSSIAVRLRLATSLGFLLATLDRAIELVSMLGWVWGPYVRLVVRRRTWTWRQSLVCRSGLWRRELFYFYIKKWSLCV